MTSVVPAPARSSRAAQNVSSIGIIILLALASIFIHELGHFTVYKIGGAPVRVTLQSVRPTGSVSPRLDLLALAAGPAASVLASALILLVMRRRPTFALATAAFTNATLRIFPCTMDLVRALKHAHPFSDEGDIAVLLGLGANGRTLFVAILLAAYLGLAALAARQYDFKSHRAAKAIGIYLSSLAVGIGVVLVDELTR